MLSFLKRKTADVSIPVDRIQPDPHREIEGNDLDAPGTSAWGQGTVVFGTRSQAASPANAAPGIVDSYPVRATVVVPDPATGGEARQDRALGWSDGFGELFSTAAFRGQVLAIRSLGVHPADGPVGFSTRSTRGKLDALYSDFTPDIRVSNDSMSAFLG